MQEFNIKNKNILITGGNSGLGLQTAKTLSKRGANVYITCRSKEKGEKTIKKIKKENITGTINFFVLDLSDIMSIANFCKNLELDKIDILINNAGVMSIPDLTITTDGLETQIGVNYFGHFALTTMLLDKLKKSNDPRVINLASIAAYFTKLRFNNINSNITYKPYQTYKVSKLCNLLFSHELAVRCPWLKSIAVHPGVVFTDIQKNASWWLKFSFYVMKKLNLSNTLSLGIEPILIAASKNIRTGMYLGPKYLLRGPVVQAHKPRESRRKTKSRQLWELSENIVSTITTSTTSEHKTTYVI